MKLGILEHLAEPRVQHSSETPLTARWYIPVITALGRGKMIRRSRACLAAYGVQGQPGLCVSQPQENKKKKRRKKTLSVFSSVSLKVSLVTACIGIDWLRIKNQSWDISCWQSRVVKTMWSELSETLDLLQGFLEREGRKVSSVADYGDGLAFRHSLLPTPYPIGFLWTPHPTGLPMKSEGSYSLSSPGSFSQFRKAW